MPTRKPDVKVPSPKDPKRPPPPLAEADLSVPEIFLPPETLTRELTPAERRAMEAEWAEYAELCFEIHKETVLAKKRLRSARAANLQRFGVRREDLAVQGGVTPGAIDFARAKLGSARPT